MTKYLNFFESESGFTEAVEADELFYPNVSYTEDDDTVHWNLAQPANPVETPMLRMHFSTSTPGQRVRLYRNDSYSGVTAMEIDGTPVNFDSEGYYGIAEPGSHTVVYEFGSPEIPERLFFVPDEPFGAFTSAEIISPVTSIVNNAFDRCIHISAVTIPDSVTSIGFQAFSICGDLTGVTIPDSVTTIGFGAFEHTGLRSITFPDSVTSISSGCCLVCTEMESARIGNGITAIPNMAFAGCDSLQRVTLPDNLTSIGYEAFLSCHSLSSIDIPSGVTAIGEEAFASCERLYDINIPSGVTTIGNEAFSRCSGLNAIYFNSETPPTLGANALLGTNNCPIYVPAASVDTYKEAWPGYASRIKTKYSISASVNDDSLGQINLDEETASEDDFVEFEVNVYDSDVNQVSSVTVTDGNGDEVECDGDFHHHHYTFMMPASDVTISVVIGEKQREKHTVTVNSTDDLVTGAYPINEETGDWDWDYEGELSFLEGEPAVFAIRLPEGYQAVSAQVNDERGDDIEAELNAVPEVDGVYECFFTMPGCDVTIFATIEKKQ